MNDRELEELLRRVPDPEPSARLLRAVAEIPLRHPSAASLGWRELVPFRWLWQGIVSAVAVLALGVAAGLATAAPAAADDESWDDLTTLTFGEEFVADDEEVAP